MHVLSERPVAPVVSGADYELSSRVLALQESRRSPLHRWNAYAALLGDHVLRTNGVEDLPARFLRLVCLCALGMWVLVVPTENTPHTNADVLYYLTRGLHLRWPLLLTPQHHVTF